MCNLKNWSDIPVSGTLDTSNVNEVMVVVNGNPVRMTKANFIACAFGELPKHASQTAAQAANDAVYIAAAGHLSATEGTVIVTP